MGGKIVERSIPVVGNGKTYAVWVWAVEWDDVIDSAFKDRDMAEKRLREIVAIRGGTAIVGE